MNPYLITCGLGHHAGNPRIKRCNIIVVVSMAADEIVRFHGGRESNRIGVGLSSENIGQSSATKSLRTGEGAPPGCKAAADYLAVKILLAAELDLIGYQVHALPTGSLPLHLTLWWRGEQPAAEDWTAFFHLTPQTNDRELRGQMDQSITAHA